MYYSLPLITFLLGWEVNDRYRQWKANQVSKEARRILDENS